VLRAQFEVNVFGWHDLTTRVIPAMRALGEGRIVFCSSVLGLIPAPFRGSYSASKFAIESLADALRMELEAGIRVALIEPGPIASRFVEHTLEAYRRNVDLERSVHRDTYKVRIAQLEAGGRKSFKLGPEAVATKLVHALESPGQNLATTSPFPLTPWPCSAGSFLSAPSTPWPGGTRVSGEDERRGRTGV
jgi:short-subunit dehydrogenase